MLGAETPFLPCSQEHTGFQPTLCTLLSHLPLPAFPHLIPLEVPATQAEGRDRPILLSGAPAKWMP